MDDIRLTQYASGAGCGCKISPAVLDQILHDNRISVSSNLLVGNASNDDAAVYDLGDGRGLLVTTDFFMPVVDDAKLFGQAAAANALSDIYAMGGTPFSAIAILGWPVNKLPAAVAATVIEGARTICHEAGVVIAGGHTIDAPEPFFGLSVNGLAPLQEVKRNNTAKEGDVLLLSKWIGGGIVATAQKRGKLREGDADILARQLTTLNRSGAALGGLETVHAMTDITGFGILGHLTEMCKGSGLTATLWMSELPLMNGLSQYISEQVIPDATYRNWNAYEGSVHIEPEVNPMDAFAILPDPQTNGGLLVAADKSAVKVIQEIGARTGEYFRVVGIMGPSSDKSVRVKAHQ